MRRRAVARGCRMNGEAPHQERSSNDTRPKYVCGLSDAHIQITHIRSRNRQQASLSQRLAHLLV